MALFMDIHRNLKGLTAEKAHEVHRKDLETQDRFGADFRQYWFDEDDGVAMCLCEAPNKQACESTHREAHGLVADEIFRVREGT